MWERGVDLGWGGMFYQGNPNLKGMRFFQKGVNALLIWPIGNEMNKPKWYLAY